MKKVLFFFLIILTHRSLIVAQTPVYLDENQPMEKRIEDALSRMTLEEKVAMCHAQSKFSSPGVPRLGIPENWMTDGPHGIRPEVAWDKWYQADWTNDSCIAFPALTCLAATWNTDMALLYGKSIGEEARYRNKNVLLGPGVNIYRTPLNGRNFEYMGEDPFLASRMVVPYVKGVQSNGVAACVKHFALNNQETERHNINVVVDDRALYEIYLPAFKAAVQKGNAWAIMGAYNKYKNQWCCHNQYLLNDILRGEWDFDGVVVSDWGGVHDTMQAIYNGLDMEFGTWTDGMSKSKTGGYNQYYLADSFLEKLRTGQVPVCELDKKVRNVLRLIYRTTMNSKRPWGAFGTEEHALAGRKIAAEGIVLLKNQDNVLPLITEKLKRILVVGDNAVRMMTVGGGSSSLKAKYEISPLDGIRKRVGDNIQVVYARGYRGPELKSYNGVLARQIPDDHRSDEELLKEACDEAKLADVIIFIGGLNKAERQDCESHDRRDLGLPYNQDELIIELCKANKNIVFVNISGNAVAMPWVKQVPAILQAWYSGTEAGNAIASILFGDVNPSGKLPFTFFEKLEDIGAHKLGDYPGINKEQTYRESIYVGYRWSDKENIKPLFSFGHGLSYTTFEYGEVKVDTCEMTKDEQITFTIEITNTGEEDGYETVQLYISDKKSSLPRPVKELKGFSKVFLKSGSSQSVTFTIDKESLSYFDDVQHKWIAEAGEFEALIGSSSTDIRSKINFYLQ
ncbi:MAG: glycoside hydrolase family 3 C-terminal domain-containing protein [Paludibacter sp.]|nr:glycoside hydrolase family 3 C-terminal domain-containing protein [Paludibacter sp.]